MALQEGSHSAYFWKRPRTSNSAKDFDEKNARLQCENDQLKAENNAPFIATELLRATA